MTAPKVHIGRAYGHQGLRTARSLTQAFGPYARLHVERTGPVIRDRTVVVSAVVLAAIALLIVNLT